MPQMHNLLKIQRHQDGNVNLQTCRAEEAVEKESKDRSVKYVHQEVEPCLELFLVFQEAGPLAVDWTHASDVSAVLKAYMCDNTWLFCRALMAASTQTVPAWAGWVTLTGGSADETPKLSRVDYMSPIINPITENSATTVQHILKVSQQASIKGWPRIHICFDLAVAKKVHTLVWQQHISLLM